VKDTKQ
jgi:hypothetical protein